MVINDHHRPPAFGRRSDPVPPTKPSFNDQDVDQWMFPRKKKRSHPRPTSPSSERIRVPSNSVHKDLQKISTSEFIINFPPDSSTKDLWKQCEQWGRVSDVYIAQRLSKSGRKFGFVRFLAVKDTKKLIENLRNIWMESYHIFADYVRDTHQAGSLSKQTGNPPSVKHTATTVKKHEC
ncbi:hypothetical protein SSX86_032529 [Deinandra increscens subsp. villosa]|uniref:RRM domain-containing protein n=1 Tax=Deinandra increscens subsp. villosa TaxID=3103831 RepID=A0AAP0C357_9ASTR